MKIFTVALVLLLVTGSQGAAIPADESPGEDSTEWQTPFWDLQKIGTEIMDVSWEKLSSFPLFREYLTMLMGRESDWRELASSFMMDITALAYELMPQDVFTAQYISNMLDMLQSILTPVAKDLHEELGSEAYAKIHEKLVSIHENIQQYRYRNETRQHHL